MEIASFAEIEKEFIERVHAMVWCNVATLDTRNRLRSRLLHPIWESGAGWAFTRRHSLKAKHIAHHPYVSLAYVADVAKPIYVDCRAQWEESPDGKQRIWNLFRDAPPPLGYDFGQIFKGVEDPECGLLKFIPWRVEMADMMNQENRRVWVSPSRE